MSTILKIQKKIGFDDSEAIELLRVFCLNWGNASELLLKTISFTDHPELLREPIRATLRRYMDGAKTGMSDIERLSLVINGMFDAGREASPDMTVDLFAFWCMELHIPERFYAEVVRGRFD